MASVFLSYDHDDADRAASIAAAIRKAGHTVWWDRHIQGGAEYNSEIECAVERADVVIVLWSERSVRSAWVRDEAAEGRDQRKLVPVCLDSAKPPMGFRQYQTIDLTAWKGRGRSSLPRELLRAIEILGKPVIGHPRNTDAAPTSSRQPSLIVSAGVAAVLLTVLALLLWRPWSSAIGSPTVAVVPNDSNPDSRALASNLLVQLGSFQASNPSELHLVDAELGAKADLTFKAGALGGPPDPRGSLSLIDNRSKTLLWSREFVQPGGNQADLRQQLAYSAGQVLRCATDALSTEHQRIGLPTLKLYLNGCADLSNLLGQDPQAAVSTFRKVIENSPRFAGGWAKLLIAERIAFIETGLSDQKLRRDLSTHIAGARKVDPTMAEAYISEAWLQPPRPIIGWMRLADEAIAKHPDNADALADHASKSLRVGRIREAVGHARRAVQVEPLSPSVRQALISAQMDNREIEAARNDLREAERLWPGATNIARTRFHLEYRYGDPRQAQRLLDSGRLGFAGSAAERSFLKARTNPSSENVEQAVADARAAFRNDPGNSEVAYIETLAQFGRNAELTKMLLSDSRVVPWVTWALFRPAFARLHKDPRFMIIAHRIRVTEYWRKSGKWPDFCFEPDLPYDCKAEAAKLQS